MKPISPCCKSEMYLSARMNGKALYKCSECKEYKLPIGYKPFNKRNVDKNSNGTCVCRDETNKSRTLDSKE